jgi:hypothetical protein
MEQARINIYRVDEYANRLRRYRVEVDSVDRGRLRAGEEMNIALPPGLHTVICRLGFFRSKPLSVRLEPGAVCYVSIGSTIKIQDVLMTDLLSVIVLTWRTLREGFFFVRLDAMFHREN